ncbi:hypothetical protein [Thermoactinospora rubra]|uniref:hypothetical protein n=1 Tax=Thermoactinospora rubra TaxID=1088767 RepID=UPI00117DE707|nr:hypothetical protein [Thermoactinospora rubra]
MESTPVLNTGRHRLTMSESSSPPATTAPPRTASLTAGHRHTGTDWVQARRWVPRSYSRPSSGAPQSAPINAGATSGIQPNTE